MSKIAYDTYLRTEAAECSECHIKRPISEFNRKSRTIARLDYRCRRCNTLRLAKDYRKKKVLLKKRYEAKCQADPLLHRKKHKRALELHGKKALYEARKISRFNREEKNQVSDAKRTDRTCRGRFVKMSFNIRQSYGFNCTAQDVRDVFLYHKTYRSLFRQWKQSGFLLKLTPVLFHINPKKVKAVRNLKIMTFGKMRSLLALKIQKDKNGKHTVSGTSSPASISPSKIERHVGIINSVGAAQQCG